MSEVHPKLKLKRKKFSVTEPEPLKKSFYPRPEKEELKRKHSSETFSTTSTSAAAAPSCPSASPPSPCSDRDSLWALTLSWILQEIPDGPGAVPDLPPSSAEAPSESSSSSLWALSDEVPPLPQHSALLGTKTEEPVQDPNLSFFSSETHLNQNSSSQQHQLSSKSPKPTQSSNKPTRSSPVLSRPSPKPTQPSLNPTQPSPHLTRPTTRLSPETVPPSPSQTQTETQELKPAKQPSQRNKTTLKWTERTGETTGGGTGERTGIRTGGDTGERAGPSTEKSKAEALMQNCPMCLMVFPLGFTQLDRDAHLAQCLSELNIDMSW